MQDLRYFAKTLLPYKHELVNLISPTRHLELSMHIQYYAKSLMSFALLCQRKGLFFIILFFKFSIHLFSRKLKTKKHLLNNESINLYVDMFACCQSKI